jgi:S1-C subfamily serine protease
MLKITKPTSFRNARATLLLLLLISLILLSACDDTLTPAPIVQTEAPVEVLEVFNEPEALIADEQNTVEIVSAFGPSVVAINVTIQGEPMRPFADIPEDQLPQDFRDLLPFLDEEIPMQQSAGSGFLIDTKASGTSYLVTNFHVVQESLVPGTTNFLDGASIEAVFPEHNDDPVPVKVVGANPSFDLALLTVLDRNPFGLEFTVTTGIGSAIGRFVPSVGQITIPMIQTDAAINPGNSGGPMLNSRGELMGVNTSIINPTGRSSAGVGFAVPSNLLIEALSNLELGGLSDIRDTRPSLGASIRTVSILPEGIRELLELPDEGVAVIEVLPGSPAEKAGLRGSQRTENIGSVEFPAGGDVITAVDGVELMNAEQLNLLITYEGNAGDQLKFTVLRDGRQINTTVTLEILE